jgi:hypothetical protein
MQPDFLEEDETTIEGPPSCSLIPFPLAPFTEAKSLGELVEPVILRLKSKFPRLKVGRPGWEEGDPVDRQ